MLYPIVCLSREFHMMLAQIHINISPQTLRSQNKWVSGCLFQSSQCIAICKSFEALESQNKLQQYKIGEIKKLSNIRFINYNFGPMKVKMRKWSTFSKAKLSPEYLLAQVTGGFRHWGLISNPRNGTGPSFSASETEDGLRLRWIKELLIE